MRSLKLIVINALTLIIGLGLMSGSVSQRNAEAARFETIPSLQINRLGNLRGQYLTVLYAVGSRPFISTDASQINISQVKESRTVYLTSDSVNLPAVQVEKEGFRPSYNIVVFVVSSQANYSWINADGTIPQGVSATSNHMSSLINSINKADVDNFVSASGQDATLTVNLN
ncbi:hypothetical protein [Bdellovibrio svalbardensis]|uniref:Uncharacterized protein n=1 Tax=Bdellovibrio svalbardensis TaxID=2972972 RepID=A0ABT6DGS6_9BACT|nr:hypothetical protein [Bdellovibrio svalbardensis]MDG0816055.1 hypothetical protein [Bdellovibrio svalbardensis]